MDKETIAAILIVIVVFGVVGYVIIDTQKDINIREAARVALAEEIKPEEYKQLNEWCLNYKTYEKLVMSYMIEDGSINRSEYNELVKIYNRIRTVDAGYSIMTGKAYPGKTIWKNPDVIENEDGQ